MYKILTIIIPTYNMEKYLDKSLSSLIISSQLMHQLEVLIINDGSVDDSYKIAFNYVKKYPDTFRIINKKNGNYGSCINRGLNEATGKYIKVLDADDSFNTTEFELFIHQLCKVDADMIICNSENVNEAGEIIKSIRIDLPPNILFDKNEIDLELNLSIVTMHRITYRKQILIENNYKQTEGISYTDTEWVIYPILYVKNIIYFDYFVYRYLVGREGQTVSKNHIKKNAGNYVTIIEKYFAYYFTHKSLFSEEVKKYIDVRIKSVLLPVYRYSIFDRNPFANKDLIALDNKIKLYSASLFDQLNNVCLHSIRYKYIKHWRMNSYSFRFMKTIISLFSYFLKI